MSATMLLTMASVFIGFLLFGASFASFMYGKSKKVIWSLFVVAVFFISVIPVSLAVFVATAPPA